MTKLKSVFLPPGVQMKLLERFETFSSQLPLADAQAVSVLWIARNRCEDSEIDDIDAQMETIAVIAEKRRILKP